MQSPNELDFNLNYNMNNNYYKDNMSRHGSNIIKKEPILDEVNDDDPKKFNLYKISDNIFNKISDLYPSNTINSTEIYRTYNYTLEEIKTKSKYFKKDDLLKRAQFFFSLYHRINCSQINQLYYFNKYNQINKNSFCVNFSNTIFPGQMDKPINQKNFSKPSINLNKNNFNKNIYNNMNSNINALNNNNMLDNFGDFK